MGMAGNVKQERQNKMARNITPSELSDLEDLVDAIGIQGVVRGLAIIAVEKSEHVRSNWQDESTGKVWDRVSHYLDRQADNKILASPLD